MTRAGRAAVVAATAVVFGLGVFGLVAQLVEAPQDGQTRVAQFLYLLEPVVTSVLGGYLVVVRPRHPAGWLTGLIAVTAAVDSLSKATLAASPGAVPLLARRWASWLDNWVWVLLFGSICLLMLTFPTGRLPGRRWRPAVASTVAAVAVEGVLCALVGRNPDHPGVPALVTGVVPEAATGVGLLAVLGAFAAAVASLVVRRRAYRRTGDATGLAQLRWLLWAGAVVLVSLLAGALVDRAQPHGGPVAAVADVVSQLAFYGFPVAMVVAVTRHGLFEIDRVVSRTVSYLVVTGLLIGLYVGLIAGLSALLPTDVNSLVVAAATLAVAALFVPVRRAVQQRVDRRFNRSRFDRAAVVERFAESLRRDVTHGSDGADLLAVVQRALEPQHAGLWLVRP